MINIWEVYEEEKKKIKAQNLTCAQYEIEINKLIERLGI